ncbi:hypothetical protein RYX36_024680 [Vicia faba]
MGLVLPTTSALQYPDCQRFLCQPGGHKQQKGGGHGQRSQGIILELAYIYEIRM